jgi:hypothetical protein
MLGEAWPGWGAAFPFACQFFVDFQHKPPEGVRLWRMVQGLRGVSGFHDVVKSGLGGKSWSDYLAGVMGLEFLSRAQSAGCTVEFIERDSGRTADARITVVDRPITVEFKALHEPDELEPWSDFEGALMAGLTRRGVQGIAFERDLEPAALTNPEAVADGLASIAVRGVREFEALPGRTGRARLAEDNMGCCGYPVENKDELARITSKLRSKKWYAQLDVEGPTLLVVRARTIFGGGEPGRVGMAARLIADGLCEPLRRLEMIGAVLVYEEPFWAPRFPLDARADELRVRIDTSGSGFARFMSLTHNPGAGTPLTEAELDRLVGPDLIW